MSDTLPPLPEPAFLSCDYSLAWSVEKLAGWSKRDSAQYTVPLFTADQMRSYAAAALAAAVAEPLTDEQVFSSEDFMTANGLYWGLPMTMIMQIVRCTERAHGIAPASAPKEQA